jgi:ATP-dependent Clp protease ATP-binding subunit ClpC
LLLGFIKTASFFFIGPTGVGKTELGKLLGKKYSGNFWKINCAEYANKHEYAKLIGSPPGYVGHTETSLMAEKAEQSNKWVILFDEIEKAHPKFYDFLLSLLR